MTARIRLTTTTATVTALALAAFSAPHVLAGDLTFIETFDAGNVGDWTWGNNFERIVPQQGNTGAWRYNFNLISCCPLLSTGRSHPSVFTGNFREMGVTSIGVDIATIFVGFASPGCHYNGLFVDVFAAGDESGEGATALTSFRDFAGNAAGDSVPYALESHTPAEQDDGGVAGSPGAWLVLVSNNGTPNNPNDDWGAFLGVPVGATTPGQGSGFNPNPNWASLDAEFPANWLVSETAPPGWTFIQLGPSVPSGAMQWQTLITDVAGIGWYLLDPQTLHLIRDFRLGIDNPRISMTGAGNIQDCNGTGNPDSYDIAVGLASDCNRNGIPDSCEIADDPAKDCNSNGVLDECEANDAAYMLDSGYHSDAIGIGAMVPPESNLIWALQFDAGKGDIIENISVAFHGSGGLQAGDSATVFLWDDPNNDGNPNDAVLLTSLSVEVLTVNSFTSTDMVSFDTYAIEPTVVTGSFFVGAMAAGEAFPALTDVRYPIGERSWSSDILDGSPTAAFQSATTLPADCLSGTFMIRANGNDANNNGLPDVCEEDILGDLDGNGVVNVFDLLQLLQEWGTCADPENCPADLDDNGVVNVFDLLILLQNWG